MYTTKKHGRFFALVTAATLAIISVLISVNVVSAANSKIKSVSLKIGKKNVTKKTFSLSKGKKATLKATVNPKKTKYSVKFKTSNKKIATVSKNGVITAKNKGTATIFVEVRSEKNKMKSWTKIKVSDKENNNTPKPTPDENNTPNPAETPEQTPTPEPITIKDLTIEYASNKIYGRIYTPQKEGKYPAVILSHGYNGVGTDFVKECTYFAQNGYVAYAFDFCGGSVNSRSSGKSTDMTIFTEKENLLAVHDYISKLENVDSDNVFLFGGSQGGLVTSLATEEIQDKVRAMILYFPALNIPDDWRRNYPTTDKIPETTDFWGLKLGKNFFLSIHDFHTFDNIGKYPNNVLIIWGDNDAIVPRSYMETAQKTYKNAELVILPGEGHGFSPAGGKTAMEKVLDFMNKN